MAYHLRLKKKKAEIESRKNALTSVKCKRLGWILITKIEYLYYYGEKTRVFINAVTYFLSVNWIGILSILWGFMKKTHMWALLFHIINEQWTKYIFIRESTSHTAYWWTRHSAALGKRNKNLFSFVLWFIFMARRCSNCIYPPRWEVKRNTSDPSGLRVSSVIAFAKAVESVSTAFVTGKPHVH